MKLSLLDKRIREGLSLFPKIHFPRLLSEDTPKLQRMEDSDPIRNPNFWIPSSPRQYVNPTSGNDLGLSWGGSIRPSDFLAPPRRNPQLPAALPSRNESVPQRPHYTNSSLNPPSRSPNRISSHFDLPNFPLQRSPNIEPHFPLPRSHDESNRTDDDIYSSYQDLAGSPLQLPSINAFSSNDFTPISRPPSRFYWDLEGSPFFGSPAWATEVPTTQELNTQEAANQEPISQESNFQDQNGFVDLTTESPIMPPINRKRKASATSSNPIKHGKTLGPNLQDLHVKGENSQVEEIDLRNVNDDNSLTTLLEQQRVAAVKAQQEQANKPLKLSSLQCIICMEPMTNITVTHCGVF